MEKFDNWCTNEVASIVSGRVLTVVVNGDYFTISAENDRFEAAKEALKNKNVDALLEAVQPIKAIENVVKKISAMGKVAVENDTVTFNGIPVHGVIVNRILEFQREGLDYAPLVQFLENLMDNPSRTVVQELYEWMERAATPMPITEDGHFLAYKRVRPDFFDMHSVTKDYSVGNIVTEERNTVDDNRSRTCSNGLHFCSLGYLPSFGGGSVNPIMILKINPRDVVAFPQDYNTSKGRCCRVEVIGIHTKGEKEAAWGARGYVDTRKEYAKPVTLDNGVIAQFVSRQDARDYVANNQRTDLTIADRHSADSTVYKPSADFRWVVVEKLADAAPKAAANPLKTFAGRDAARVNARATGGKFVDLWDTSQYDKYIVKGDQNRWGVFNG